jgi:hypothetical protein
MGKGRPIASKSIVGINPTRTPTSAFFSKKKSIDGIPSFKYAFVIGIGKELNNASVLEKFVNMSVGVVSVAPSPSFRPRNDEVFIGALCPAPAENPAVEASPSTRSSVEGMSCAPVYIIEPKPRNNKIKIDSKIFLLIGIIVSSKI